MIITAIVLLMGVGMVCVVTAVFSVLGHGLTSRSPRFEPLVLFAVGPAFIAAGFYLLRP